MGERDFFGDGSCVCWYEFNDNADDTGGVNHGTPTDVTYAEGSVSNRCAVFNGSSSRIMLPILLSDTSSFTVSFYINSSASVCIPVYFGAYTGANKTSAFGLFKQSGSNYYIVTNNNEGVVQYSVDLDVSNMNWDHVVGVLTPTSLTAYLNGEPVGSTTTTGTRPSFHAESNLGGNISGSWWFNGMLDEFRVFNRALTSDEVRLLLLGASRIRPYTPTPVILSTMPASLTRGFR